MVFGYTLFNNKRLLLIIIIDFIFSLNDALLLGYIRKEKKREKTGAQKIPYIVMWIIHHSIINGLLNSIGTFLYPYFFPLFLFFYFSYSFSNTLKDYRNIEIIIKGLYYNADKNPREKGSE